MIKLNNLYNIIIGICFFSLCHAQVNNSVLSNGTWYKFSVDKSGMFVFDLELAQSSILKDNPNADINKIQIFSSNGGMLPEANNLNRTIDLVELTTQKIGFQDGSWDNNDKIIFYAEGPNVVQYDGQSYSIDKHVYDVNNYVFVHLGNNNSQDIAQAIEINSNEIFNYKTTVKRFEEDRINLLGNFSGTIGTGKVWYGSNFRNNNTQVFSDFFTFPNLVFGSSADVDMSFAGRSDNTTQVELNIDGFNKSKNISKVKTGDNLSEFAKNVTFNEVVPISNNPNISIEYSPSDALDEAWLDYLQIAAFETIQYSNEPLFIFNEETIGLANASFKLNSSSNQIQVWDVSNIESIQSMKLNNGVDGYSFGFVPNATQLSKFIAFDVDQIRSKPTLIGQTSNQNLRAIKDIDFLIVHHDTFALAAQKLGDFRAMNDGLNVAVTDVHQIYNEFGGGKKDPIAIRDFAKYLYDNNESFKYLLFIGDSSYDFRGISPDLIFDDYVPSYQTNESLDPIDGFPTDDYFALLDDNEGNNLTGSLDIAIGRLPASTPEEANNMINKIISYEKNKDNLGEWRLNLGFTADDEDGNLHLDDSDGIAEASEAKDPIFNQQKVYFDAFNQESTPGGDRYPDATSRINNNIFKGQLILNYLGHGGPKGWAQERVLQTEHIKSWDNEDRLTIIISATCEFTPFDDQAVESAGEQAILKPDGGAVALFTTVRAVYASRNEQLTSEVYEELFNRDGEGNYMRIGEMLMNAKNNHSLSDLNARKFLLIGDPTMRLGAPKNEVFIDKINGKNVSESIDTINALDVVTIEGHVEDFFGNELNDFNGILNISVFDKKSEVKTLGNDDIADVEEFSLYQNVLFKGSAPVDNGKFEVSFIVPGEIDFDIGQGKISMYVSDGVSEDGAGYYDNIIIGGSSTIAIEDLIAPEMDLFMNNTSFRDGGITSPDPILLIQLSDDLGINVTGAGIGHDIVARLDGDETFILNEFYEANLGDFSSGSIRFPFQNLSIGIHQLKVKAWDITNLSVEKELSFEVIEDGSIIIQDVQNYPNPFSNSTTFGFEHNLPLGSASTTLYIYNSLGQLVTKQNQIIELNGFRNTGIEWSTQSNQVPSGIYFYQISIQPENSEKDYLTEMKKFEVFN